MEEVDVVVVNYNSGGYLRRAIGCLQRQTHKSLRVILVDNASTDDSLQGLPEGPVPIVVVRSSVNLGFAGANNLALNRHVTARWVALLNPDAFPHDDWLSKLLASATPPFTFFASRLLCADRPERLDGAGDAYHVSGLHWRMGHWRPAYPPAHDVEEVFSPCAAAALYRTNDLLAVGGFDESYFCYSEDVDIAFRLRLAGGRCAVVHMAVAEHVGSGSAGKNSDFAVYLGHRNLVWTFVKNMPLPLLLLFLPAHIGMTFVALAVFASRGQGRVIWRAKMDALRAIPLVWRKRRDVQSTRSVSAWAIWRVLHKGRIQ